MWSCTAGASPRRRLKPRKAPADASNTNALGTGTAAGVGVEPAPGQETSFLGVAQFEPQADRLAAAGVDVAETEDSLTVHGAVDGVMGGVTVAAELDHRIAMAFAIAGLFAEGETIVEDTACVNTSYPSFESTLKRFI